MFNIKKFPIVIISSPRSGSTPLAFELKNKYNIEIFNETFSPQSIRDKTYYRDMNRLLQLSKDSKSKFVLKIHIDDLNWYPDEVTKLIKEHRCYLIRIRRNNIVNQCTSLYIEKHRNMWGYTRFINEETMDTYKNTEVPVVQTTIEQCIAEVINVNRQLDRLTYAVDQDVWYEDLQFKDRTFFITPKPSNYSAIQEKIETYLKHKKLK